MNSLSPLQIVPLHIAQIIVNYVAESSSVVSSGVLVNSKEYRSLLKPLLWVCSNFRAIAYPLYFCQAKLELSSTSNDVKYSQVDSLGLGYPSHHLAKEIVIEVSDQAVYSGEALKLLSQEPYDGCAFPLARTLTFAIVTDEDEGGDGMSSLAVAAATISVFVQRVKRMAPVATKIGVRPSGFARPHYVTGHLFGILVSQLFQLVSIVEYISYFDSHVPVVLQLDSIRNLSHIRYAFESSVDQLIQLARLNAPTLQSLTIESETDIDVSGLLRDDYGNYVTYPHLLLLKLWDLGAHVAPQRLAFKGAVPFPSLRVLRMWLSHSFEDDTFFRGNALTLESLEIRLGDSIIQAIRRHNVFTPGSHPKLRHVGVEYLDGIQPDCLATIAEAIEFELSIGPKATVRDIGGLPSSIVMATFISSLGKHTCIQVLTLPHLSPVLWDVITLIKALPLLSDLHTMSPRIGSMPAGITHDDLPSFMISTFAPMGEKFRCWHLNIYNRGSFAVEAQCVLLLALVCPNYAAAAPSVHSTLMDKMEETIASAMFKQYAPRLRRLLSYKLC
ncbi:hypothetical protein GGH13_001556 [Coemansia sp. S155-1]|nr:hypothetical protein GGH13_001556 [Coemansia sp. S155-1]